MHFKIITVVALLLFNFLVDRYVYIQLKRIVSQRLEKWFKIVFWSSSLLFLLFVLFCFLLIKYVSVNLDPVFFIWCIYACFLVCFPRWIFAIVSVLDYFPLLVRKRRVWFFTPLASFVWALLIVLILYGAFYTRLHPQMTEHCVMTEKLPKEKDLKLIHISDLHLGNMPISNGIMKKTVEMINLQNPDLIFITGDIVNQSSKEMDDYMQLLSEIKSRYGVYVVLGNHDYGDYQHWESEVDQQSDFFNLHNRIAQLGWTLLNNESIELPVGGDTISIIGIEHWRKVNPYADLQKAMQGVRKDHFQLLLSHNPNIWDAEILGKTAIDLTLSGHTHAIQMKMVLGTIQLSPAVLKYKRWGGAYQELEQTLYVNEGLSYVLYPMRIGTPPEITLINLKGSRE